MSAFVAMAKEKGLATLASTVCATGGGAYKFEADIKREVNLRLNKFDELDSLIRGEFKLKLDFILSWKQLLSTCLRVIKKWPPKIPKNVHYILNSS